MSKFDDFYKKKKELEELIHSFGQEKLKEEFTEWFKDVPELKAFGWVQYTPHFNDGEPCEFNVHEAGFIFTDEDLQKVKDGETSFWDYDTYYIKDEEVKKKCQEINRKLQEMEDILHSVFGDGYTIIVTPTEIVSEFYDHD